MSEPKIAKRSRPAVPTAMLVALPFGLAALTVVLAGLTIPLPGTRVVTDPRELFAATGAALTGPFGGMLIGILAGVGEPIEVLPSLFAHVVGGLGIGLAYKKLAYERLSMPALLLGWAALVVAYYFVLLVPGFVIGQALFSAPDAAGSPWQIVSLLDGYGNLAHGALPEIVLVTLITTMALAALPRRYRRPLW